MGCLGVIQAHSKRWPPAPHSPAKVCTRLVPTALISQPGGAGGWGRGAWGEETELDGTFYTELPAFRWPKRTSKQGKGAKEKRALRRATGNGAIVEEM